ncbi:hypothetical protein ACHAXN_010661 [Cyclotella atomus]
MSASLCFVLVACMARKSATFTPPSRSISSISVDECRRPICCFMQNPSIMIDDVLRGNSTAALSIVSSLNELRGADTMDQYLSEMMPPEPNNFPVWARLPLSRYSRRARQIRLRKLLELSTPAPDNASDDDEDSKKRRGRRALFVLLRNIANNPDNYKGIKALLAEVRRDAKNTVIISPNELQKRTPDIETPKYEVLKTAPSGLEIRRYEQFSVCSVTMKDLNSKSGSDKESASKLSNPQLSGASSFGALAGYLFGKNQAEKAKKMTAPVLTEGEGEEKKMSFVLPSDYWKDENLSSVPKPLLDSAVKIRPVEGSSRAVIAFGGYGGKASDMSKKLIDLLEKDEDWSAAPDAVITLAQYNDPFTPPWKRRNEVSIIVVPSETVNMLID